MQDQVARVKSSLLLFPEVTLEALGEDEITLDSVLRGKFAAGKNGLAWLACGPHLEVVNSVTGERLSAYRFSGVKDPPTVLAVKEFSWQKRNGLLVGIEAKGSVLCLYDMGISRVIKAVVLPGRVTAIEPIINHGGASASTQHLHQSLRWFFGVAAVVTDVGHILLVDLCLDDLSCNHDELKASDLEVMSGISPEIPHIRESVTRQRRQLCLQLISPSGTPVTCLSYIARTNQLAVGFSSGYLSLWNMKTLKREYHCLLEGGRVPVYAVAFQEPENDPRSCCYLWAVQSTQETEGDLVSLHLLQLAFGDRKCLPSGQILYEGLEYCDERYSLDLTGGVFSLRNQTSNTRLLGCQTVERFRSHGERDDSLSEAVSPDTSVSVFSWQVNIYGQGKPSTYLAVFDINRWYHAQMPDSLRHGEFLHNSSYFTLWSLDAVVTMTSPHYILDVLVHERSLSRGVPPSYPPPEQFFNPSTYNFDATCLMNSGVVHVACIGLQKGTLHFLKKSGPFVSEAVPDVYNRCLVAGLLSPRLADVQTSGLSQEEQMQAVLSTAVGTCSLGLLTGSIKQWTAEVQPSSGANLRFILEWTWTKVITTKDELDRLCASLFDGSCNFIDPQILQSLQHCHLLLGNLCSVLNCFLTEAQKLTTKGFIDLTNKKVVVSLLFLYTQVVLWFCRSGLLPEGSDFAADMQLSRPSYNYLSLHNYYMGHRQKLERLSRGKWNSDCLMIDGMVSQFGDRIENLWSRDDGGTGKYPPATLHALLDIYLLENVEESMKHAITIYLLLDIISSIPNKTETTIESFPTAFAIPLGLVKLIEGFWFLDHSDHKTSLDGILHPATSWSMLTWYHARIINALMCQGEHQQALRYIQMMKPPLTSSKEVTLHLTVLLCNRSIVEAMNLLRLHSSKLNVNDLLRHMYETCQEMGLMEDLLKLPFTELEQECLENFLQNSGGVKNQEFLLVHHLQRANYISALQLNQSLKLNMMNDREPRFQERADARNSILDQYGKVLPRVQMRLAAERTKPYSLPSSVLREVTRPTPLSTVVKQISTGNIVSKATFINHVLSKIREVSANEQKDDYSPYKSFTNEDSLIIPDAFVGTPRTKTSQRTSRLLNSLVRPVPQSSPGLASYRQTSGGMNSSLRPASSPSPLQSNLKKPEQMKNILKASEFSLLETPLVVRRAKALSMCGVHSGLSGYTPQSILRSSLRTTPLVSPCLSPERSISPPLRSKETKISFMEEKDNAQWTNGTAGDCKTKLLLFDTPVMKSMDVPRATWENRTEKMSSFQSGHSGCVDVEINESQSRAPENSPSKMDASKEISSISEKSKKKSYLRSSLPMCLDLEMDESSLSEAETSPSKMDGTKELSNVSAKTDQSTGEFLDAQSSEDFDDDLVFINCNPPDSVFGKPTEFHNWMLPDQIVKNGQPEFQQTENGHFNVSQLEHDQCPEEGMNSTAETHIEFQKLPGEYEESVIYDQLELEEQKPSFEKDDKELDVVQLSQYHVVDLVNTITGESSKLQSGQENEVVLENEPEDFKNQTCFPVEDHNNLKKNEVEYLIIPENEVALLDDMSTEHDTVPENGVVGLDHLNTVQDVDIPASLLPVDSETLENEFGEKTLSVKSSTCTSESTIADAESVICIHDSDDIACTNSENWSEESNHEYQSKDCTTVDVLEKNEITKEAAPMTDIHQDYADSSRNQIKVLENNDELEMHLEETGEVQHREIVSMGTCRIISVFEESDKHFGLEMVDGKESTECEMTEMGGEMFVGENNFSLVLEEGESDPGIPMLELPENTANVIKNVEEQKKPYSCKSILSFLTTVPEPTIAEALKLVSENSTIETLPNVSEMDWIEAQPRVSEPIKEALTDKVLVVCSDQDNINIHSEVVSQTGANITSLNPIERTSVSAAEANGGISFSHVNESLTSELHLRTQNLKDLTIQSNTTQNFSPKEHEKETKAHSTPKRSSRRTKDLLESEEILVDKQISQTFTPRKRISRKDQLFSTPQPGESIQPTKEVEPETYILRSGFKKTKGSISDSPDILSTENLLLKGILIPDTPKRISRSTHNSTEEQMDKKLIDYQELKKPTTPSRSASSREEQMDKKLIDHQELKKPTTPSRSASSREEQMENQLIDHQELKKPTTPRRSSNQSKEIAFEISESITLERVTSETKADRGDSDQQLPSVSKNRAKGGRVSLRDRLKHPVLDSSKLTYHEELPSTPRRSTRRAVLSVSEVSAMSPKPQLSENTVKGQEHILKAQRLTKRIDTSKRDNQSEKDMAQETLDKQCEENIDIHNRNTRTITINESQLHSIAEDTQLKISPYVAREERTESTVLVLSGLPSSAEKLKTARKSTIFKDDAERAGNERLQEAAEVLQTVGVSEVVQIFQDLGGNILQPSLADKEHSGLSLIIHSTSNDPKNNNLGGPNLPNGLDDSTYKSQEKDVKSGHVSASEMLGIVQTKSVSLTPKRGARGRNKSVVEPSKSAELNVTVSLLPAVELVPFTPRRSSRRGASNLSEITENNPPAGSGLAEPEKILSASSIRGRRGKTSQISNKEDGIKSTSEGTSEESSSELVPIRNRRGQKKEYTDNKEAKGHLPSVSEESTLEKSLPSPKKRERLYSEDSALTTFPNLHPKVNPPDDKDTLKAIEEEAKHKGSSKDVIVTKHGSRMTKINNKRKKHSASIAEENTDKMYSELPESKERLHGTDSVLTVTPVQHRKAETVVEHSNTRTRSSILPIPPYFSADSTDHFVFSHPFTKRKNKNAIERKPILHINIESDMTPQFVYSPPALRTRRKDQSSISDTVKEQDILIKESAADVEEPVVKKRGRQRQSKAKDSSTSANVPWSPPPVEVNLISPLASPATETKSKTSLSSDEPTEKMTLRRNRKRLVSTFAKPVTRRKMR